MTLKRRGAWFGIGCVLLLGAALASCKNKSSEPGSFNVIFDWADREPAGTVWVYARVEQDQEAEGRIVVAEAPLAKYKKGVVLVSKF